jgi:SAM-dependent methyltransferase
VNWRARVDKWLAVSPRRRSLDIDLVEVQHEMTGRVLEIGAGRNGRRGDFSPPLDKATFWFFLDLSRNASPHVQATIAHLPFPVGSFDCVVCLEVLEYVPNPGAAIKELRRSMASNAKLVISLPFMHRQDTRSDLWRFTQAGAVLLLEQHGFEVVSVKQQGAAAAVVTQITKFWLNRVPGRLWAGRLFRPFFQFIWDRDESLAKKDNALVSFSTGYLIVARPVRT